VCVTNATPTNPRPRIRRPSKFAAKPTVLKLTDELVGSLRALKPESNLFTDRFESLQKRNLIEVRTRNKRGRRYKQKEYEKRSYKNYDLNRSINHAQKARGKAFAEKAETERERDMAASHAERMSKTNMGDLDGKY
jgi:hypothetical protein